MRIFLIFAGLGVCFWLVVILTGLGVTPEREFTTHIAWFNIAGTPFTTFEWVLTVLIMLVASSALYRVLKQVRSRDLWLDAGLMLGLTILAALVWGWTPFKSSSFQLISAPYFQPYPQSDATIHDIGAISILIGKGINFGLYTDKPLYMVFLAVLHLFSGYNYSLLVFLQICFLAFMAPAVYWFGKSFHSRSFGILSALVLILHQRNAIQLTGPLYYNAAPNLLLTEVPTLFSIILFTWVCFAWIKKPSASMALAAGGILGISALLRLNSFLILPFIPLVALLVTSNKKKWLAHTLLYLLGFFILITPWLITGQDLNGKPYFVVKFFDIINVRYSDTTNPLEPPTPAPGDQTLPPQPGQTPNVVPPRPYWLLDVNRFPGFVFNNFLHNIVESILVLPDSLNPQDQILNNLGNRFYWKTDTFDTNRIPFVILNSILLILGLTWSWKNWKWAGLVPILVFLVYSLSLALGRTSGSRYLVPIDWLIFLYFSLGAFNILELFMPVTFRPGPLPEPAQSKVSETQRHAYSARFWGVFVALVILATFIPVANKLVPQNTALCQPGDLSSVVIQQAGLGSTEGLNLLKGLVLYPATENKAITFGLLSCSGINSVKIKAPTPMLRNGEIVIVGWPSGASKTDPQPLSILIPVK